MLTHLLQSVGIGITCGVLLNVLYVAVKHQWPENYFQLDSSADPVVSRNLRRYVAFRFIPPFLVFCAAAVTAQRIGGFPSLAAFVAAGTHIALLVVAIVRALSRRVRYRLAIGRSIIVVILLSLCALATKVYPLFVNWIPTPEELVSSLWVGAIAAVGAVFLQRIALVKRDPLSLALESTREIESALFQHAQKKAIEAGVDPTLLFTFMVTEDLQRPKWYRSLERRVPGGRRRTTGIMQQLGAKSDTDSIDLAIAECFVPAAANLHARLNDPSYEDMLLDEALRIQTEDPTFQKLVRGLYYSLQHDPEWQQVIATKIRGRT